MKLVTLLLMIQIGLILAKSIDYNHCNDSSENNRLKRSGEKDISFNLSDSENTYSHNVEQENTENNSHKEDYRKEFLSEKIYKTNLNIQPNKMIIYVPDTTEEDEVKVKDLAARNNEPENTVIYEPIDPKYIVTFGPYLIKNYSKNATVNTEVENDSDIDVKETIIPNNGTVLFTSNMASRNFDVNEVDDDNITVEEGIDETDADLTNIRELRVKLLDHLLDYFLNIIKDGDYNHNNTRKKSDDEVTVEEKLRNYYDKQHIDLLIDDDDDEIESDYDIDDDYRRANDDEDSSTQDEQNDTYATENTLNSSSSSSLGVNINKKANDTTAIDNLQNLNDTSPLNNQSNASNNLTETLKAHVELKPAVNSKYIDLIQKEDKYNLMLNSTDEYKGYHDDSYSNSTVTPETTLETVELAENTTERTNYEDGVVVIDDYSYEEYIDSGENPAGKNITLEENDTGELTPTVVTTDDSRINVNVTDKNTDYVPNYTQDDIISDNITSKNVSKVENVPDIEISKELKDKSVDVKVNPKSPKVDIVNSNIIDNKNGDNSKSNKLKRINEKSRRNNRSELLNKSNKHKSYKSNCRKGFVLNLNINLM